MRIIAGEWRGRPLVAPAGSATRPTSDRAREALFSMLASRIGSFEGLRVADLFAGSGALGLEALSRGAGHCSFVEQDRAAITALKTNIERLNAGGRTEVRASSVLSLGHAIQPFDLLLLDPPFGTGAGAVALDKLARQGWAASGAWASVETGRGETVAVKGWTIDAERVYGKAKLTLLTYSG